MSDLLNVPGGHSTQFSDLPVEGFERPARTLLALRLPLQGLVPSRGALHARGLPDAELHAAGFARLAHAAVPLHRLAGHGRDLVRLADRALASRAASRPAASAAEASVLAEEDLIGVVLLEHHEDGDAAQRRALLRARDAREERQRRREEQRHRAREPPRHPD